MLASSYRRLGVVLAALTAVERWLETAPEGHEEPAVAFSIKAAKQVKEQDVQGSATLRKGVAKDRRISVEDPEMRHGRKSRSVRVDGYKRHVLHEPSHRPHPSSRNHPGERTRSQRDRSHQCRFGSSLRLP